MVIQNKQITTPLWEIVQKVKQRCTNGKLAVIKQTNTDIQVCCPNPNHKGGHEEKPSGGIYTGTSTKVNYGTYHCFACGMSCSFSHFVAMCFDSTDAFAESWLVENFAAETSSSNVDLPPISSVQQTKTVLPEFVLENFQSYHPYMQIRKLDRSICKQFQVSYDPQTECIVFPVRDENNKLVMLTRRSVKEKKFIIDADKEKPLYLLNEIKKQGLVSTMITEAQIDALTAWGFGVPCIATMGAISEHQIQLLNNSGIRVLYLMFDADTAGQSFARKLQKQINKSILTINVPIIIGNKKDINDLTKDEFYKCIEFAKNNI